MPGGRVLGCLTGNMKLADTRLVLALGETLIYYTDGLTEAFGRTAKRCSAWKVSRRCWAVPAALPLEACAERVATAVRQFTATAELQDDQTLLLLRRT